MWGSDKWKDFEILDCSGGEKLERWGAYTLVRPDPQVIWNTPKKDPLWSASDARYSRSSSGGGAWDKNSLPESWQISYGELRFNVKPMNFKHTGLFPEQASNWDWAMEKIRSAALSGRKGRFPFSQNRKPNESVPRCVTGKQLTDKFFSSNITPGVNL